MAPNDQRSILDPIERTLELNCTRCTVPEKMFTALLHKLTTGEVRVTDPDLSAHGAATIEGARACP